MSELAVLLVSASDSTDFDIIVIGAGFGGSLAAMVCRRLGKSVLLIERGRHPRFSIGESTTPLTNLLLETLGKQYSLPFLEPLANWGRWQATYPELPCGLKRGFSFFHHTENCCFDSGSDRRNELLVAASPSESVADTHWYRPDFDTFLVDRATEMGVTYWDQAEIVSLAESPNFLEMEIKRGSQCSRVRGQFVIDASGPRGALFRHLGLSCGEVGELPQTQAVYSHFRNVRTCASLPEFEPLAAAPFAIDDAAVHHLFRRGWVWVLRFNHGLTSAGIVTRSDGGSPDFCGSPEVHWQRELGSFPTLRQLFDGAEPVTDFHVIKTVPFATAQASGTRWALLPAATASIDPLFSTGFPLNLLGILRLGELLADDWGQSSFAANLERYSVATVSEARQTRRLVGLAYRAMGSPRVFRAVSYLYFAAVSFEESLRRLSRVRPTHGFLLGQHSKFAGRIEACLGELEQLIPDPSGTNHVSAEKVEATVLAAVEPFNVIGIGQQRWRNWYPVDFDTFFAAGSKLDASKEELQEMLLKAGISLPSQERRS